MLIVEDERIGVPLVGGYPPITTGSFVIINAADMDDQGRFGTKVRTVAYLSLCREVCEDSRRSLVS